MDASRVLWPLTHRLALREPDLGFVVEVTLYPSSIKPHSERFTTSRCGTAESFQHKDFESLSNILSTNGKMKDLDIHVKHRHINTLMQVWQILLACFNQVKSALSH